MESLHGDDLEDVPADAGGIVAGQVAEEGTDVVDADALCPHEEVGDAEIGDGGHLEGDGRGDPVAAPVVSAETVGTQNPVKTQVSKPAPWQ